MPYLELDASYIPSDRIQVPHDLRVAELDAARPSATTAAGWIVCRGGLRLASGGLVACPVGGTTSIDDCLACRFLEAVENDRDAAYGCATDATVDSAPAARVYHDVPSTSYELAVELL